MGRIKTKNVKRVTEELTSSHGDEFSDDFNTNKKVVQKYADIPSKKLRNIVAGYVTRITKTRKEI